MIFYGRLLYCYKSVIYNILGQVNLGRDIFIFILINFGVVHGGDGGTGDDFLKERAGKNFRGDNQVPEKSQLTLSI